jgi:hypothetical protein
MTVEIGEKTNTTLLDQLEAERADHELEAAHARAVRKLDEDSLPSTKNSLAEERQPGVMLGYSGAWPRIKARILRAASERAGIPAAADPDTARLSSDEPQIIWRNINGATEVAYYDPGRKMAAAAAEIEAEMYKPFAHVIEQIGAGANQAATETRFDLSEASQDVVFAFMDVDPHANNPIQNASEFARRVYGMCDVHRSGDGYPSPLKTGQGIYLRPDGSVEKILLERMGHPGVYKAMYFSEGSGGYLTTESFRLGVEIDERRASLEISDNRDFVSESFLSGRTGRELVTTLTGAGLKLSDKVLDALQGTNRRGSDFSRRYGNTFSELGRHVAMLVNDPDYPLSNLFEGETSQIVDTLLAVDTSQMSTETAKTLITLMQYAVARDPANLDKSDVTVYPKTIRYTAGSCKDAETNCVQALQHGRLTRNGKMIGSDGGQHMAENVDPELYKGILLPPGCLFQAFNDGYAFVRITALAFDEADAADAFTWQYKEAQATTHSSPGKHMIGRFAS